MVKSFVDMKCLEIAVSEMLFKVVVNISLEFRISCDYFIHEIHKFDLKLLRPTSNGLKKNIFTFCLFIEALKSLYFNASSEPFEKFDAVPTLHRSLQRNFQKSISEKDLTVWKAYQNKFDEKDGEGQKRD